MENEPVSEGQVVLQGHRTEGTLMAQVQLAKTDKQALNTLLHDYMPFIKKCVSAVFFKGQSKADNLTEAMLAFTHSVQTYNPENGAFIPYAQIVIRNRLLNAAKKEMKIKKTFFAISTLSCDDENEGQWEFETARRQYEIAEEHNSLKMETAMIHTEFDRWGFGLLDLVKNSPKQNRSRRSCQSIAQKALENGELIAEMFETHTLPIKKLAALCGCSEKTLEKYRRYIVSLIIIMKGDYPYIRSFLPQIDGTETGRKMSGAMNGMFTNLLFLLRLV